VAYTPSSSAISFARSTIRGIRSGVIFPPSLGKITSSPPNAAIVRNFSTANASDVTIRNGYPFCAQTNASDDPVLPPLYSTTAIPGRNSPRRSAPSIIPRAIRSLYDPVGLKYSSFTSTVAAPSGTTRRNRTTGVLPIASRVES
jgi:hypothetical protein